jgi:hypothetical protein
MKSVSTLGGALVALAALAACEDAPQSTLIDMRVESAFDFLRYAGSQGPVLVEIIGEPFAGGAKVEAEQLATQMKATFTEPWISFTADKAKAAQPDYRMIWVVDPPPSLAIDAACLGKATTGTVRRAEHVALRVYFCNEQKTLSAVQGSVRRPTRADDSSWRELVKQMTRQLVGNRSGG